MRPQASLSHQASPNEMTLTHALGRWSAIALVTLVGPVAASQTLPRVAPPLRVADVLTPGELAAAVPPPARYPRGQPVTDGTRFAFPDAERGQALNLTIRTTEHNVELYAWNPPSAVDARRFMSPDAAVVSDDPKRWEWAWDGPYAAYEPAPGRLAVGRAEALDDVDPVALAAVGYGPAWEVQADRSLHRSLAEALGHRATMLPRAKRMVRPEALVPLLRAVGDRAGVGSPLLPSGYAVAPGLDGEPVEAGYAILGTGGDYRTMGRVVVNTYELTPERSAEVARLTGEDAWGFERFSVRGWPARRVAAQTPPLPEPTGGRLAPPPPMPMPTMEGSFSTTEIFVGDGVRVVVESLSADVGQGLMDALDLDAIAAVPAQTVLVAPPVGAVPAADWGFEGVAPLGPSGHSVAAVLGEAEVQFDLPDGTFAGAPAGAGCSDGVTLAVVTPDPVDPCLDAASGERRVVILSLGAAPADSFLAWPYARRALEPAGAFSLAQPARVERRTLGPHQAVAYDLRVGGARASARFVAFDGRALAVVAFGGSGPDADAVAASLASLDF